MRTAGGGSCHLPGILLWILLAEEDSTRVRAASPASRSALPSPSIFTDTGRESTAAGIDREGDLSTPECEGCRHALN